MSGGTARTAAARSPRAARCARSAADARPGRVFSRAAFTPSSTPPACTRSARHSTTASPSWACSPAHPRVAGASLAVAAGPAASLGRRARPAGDLLAASVHCHLRRAAAASRPPRSCRSASRRRSRRAALWGGHSALSGYHRSASLPLTDGHCAGRPRPEDPHPRRASSPLSAISGRQLAPGPDVRAASRFAAMPPRRPR